MQNPPYNYLHFSKANATPDTSTGPKAGEPAADFSAKNLDGQPMKFSDFFGKTIVLESCSITSPIYVSKIKSMQALQQKFPDVQFLLLYTREAHPGSKIRPHKLFTDKIKQARLLKKFEAETRTILVDDINGSAHHLYGTNPNFCYIIDHAGKVIYANQEQVPERTEIVLEKLSRHEAINPESINQIPTPAPPSWKTRCHVFYRAGWRSLFDAIFYMLFVKKRD